MNASAYALRRQTPTGHDLDWLLASLILALTLHVMHLAPWITAMLALLLGWRYLAEKKGWQLPGFWVLLPMTVLGALGIMLTYHGLFGRDASVALLALMLGLKLMESRNNRDFVLVVFLGYFLTVNAFLFTQSIAVALLMLLPVFGLTATLCSLNHPTKNPRQWHLHARLALRIVLQAVPLMLILFVLFPRLPGPLWGVPKDAYRSMTGLSDAMTPGNISELSLSGAIAFRVAFQGKAPPQHLLYWRGPVFSYYDGTSWRASGMEATLPPETLQLQGPAVAYTVTLEPHNRPWMLMLDIPVTLPAGAMASHDLQVLAREPIRARIRYSGNSHTDYRLGLRLNGLERSLALQLPADGNPRAHNLAAEWQSRLHDPQAIVNAALRMYREQPFVYTLNPPRLGAHGMDDFLFATRRGFCEHYAGSFVFLMRAAGIPARVVTGYQGGELNPLGDYLIVRQSDAHAWAEVWLEGRGWVRVDPTAAVSPSRIERGIANAVNDTDALPLLARMDYPLLRKLYLNWDAVNNGWNQWVLGYNQQRQMDLMTRIFGKAFSWHNLGLVLAIGVIAPLGALSYILLRRKSLKRAPLQQLYLDFQKKLAKLGVQRLPHEGPLDFRQRAIAHLPTHAQPVDRIMNLYTQAQYGGHPDRNTLKILRKLIRNFK